ncbi:hypothetical protein [Helicobacter pylori]|uniref:hypothetical protein n=1 Tax=Helicobacter pylori TaxID=210 RepID=UPI0002E44D07|nr:hypothetical protein [Helicobacter pylori]
MYKCRFQQLGEFITETLLENSRKKIIESNCNKALKVIEKLQEAIKTTIYREINPTIKEIKDKQPEAYSNLDRSGDKFVSNLNNSVFKEIERFKSDFRIEMYAHIDRDIEDDECRVMFKHELQKGMEKLGENIRRCFNECMEQFSKDIKEDIGQFEERIKDSLAMLEYISIYSGNTDFNFNIASGINKIGLFASMGGLVILGLVNFWNPMGWIELTLAGLLGLVGIVKSVWSFFSSDYKKSQQKKEVDENLGKVCEIIEEEMRNKIEDAKKIISENVENIKARLNDPVVCYERMREGLRKADKDLSHLSNNIKTRIAQ